MIKKELFDDDLQQMAEIARVMSHPARLEILRYISQQASCISGDISDELPLSRTTVSQHLKELKRMGLIKGEVQGVKIKYCLNQDKIKMIRGLFEGFFDGIESKRSKC